MAKSVSEAVQDMVSTPKDLSWKTQSVQVGPGSQGNDRKEELVSGQI